MTTTSALSAAFDHRMAIEPAQYAKPDWTPMKDKLLEVIYTRHGAKVAASALRMTQKQVINRAHLLGIRSAKNTRHTLEFCHELLAEWVTKTAGQIAKERNMTPSMVISCIRRAKRRPLA